jgi:excisionase family DNA binding protein
MQISKASYEQTKGTDRRPGNRLLRVSEVADILGVGSTTAWALVANGNIPSVKIGRSRRVRAHDLEDWIDGRETAH